MRNIFILLWLMLAGQVMIAQVSETDSTRIKVYSEVDVMPEFKGGEEKMTNYIQKHLAYPPKAYKEGRGGISYISFIVERNGSLSDIRVIRGASGGTDLDEAAIEMIKAMPKWRPGKLHGKKVRVHYTIPVRFIGV